MGGRDLEPQDPTRARPQRHLIVIAHPEPTSFNHALLEAAIEALDVPGHEVIVSDLYAEGFDPLLPAGELHGGSGRHVDVAREQKRVRWADHLAFLFPVWWFDRPAILKGWCDRVLEPGFAYGVDAEAGCAFGMLGTKRASIVATFAAREEWVDGGLATRGLAEGTLGFCGVDDVVTRHLFAVPRVDDAARRAMLVEVRAFMEGRREGAGVAVGQQ